MENQALAFRTGKKVILRPILEEDIPSFQLWMNDPEVTQYLRTYLPVSLQEERAWFEKVSKPTADSVTLAIVHKDSGQLIGAIGLHGIDHRSGTATTGTSIGSKGHWGQGYGTEAKMLLLEFAFRELNLLKIYSDVICYNKRSLAYAAKCGYVEEARLPAHYYSKGKRWDKVILAVYRKSWEKLWKKKSEKAEK